MNDIQNFRGDHEEEKSVITLPEKNDDFDLNLFNPLWAYDLFPPAQCSWSRMPFAGDNFATESSANGNPEQSDNSCSDNSNIEENSSAEPSSSNPDIDNSDKFEPNNEQDSDSDNSSNNNSSNSNNNNDNIDDESSNPDDGDGNGNDEDETELTNENKDDKDPTCAPNHNTEYNIETSNQLPQVIPGLTITENHDGSFDYHREFNSWDEFVACAADESLYAWKEYHESHEKFQGTAGAEASFNEAVQMAGFCGWPEGRELLSDLMTNIYTKPEIFETWGFDVAGMFPVVPAYLSGDPACMMVEPDISLRAQHPIIRIDYNNYVAHFVKPRDMMVRGAAILSLANNLEDHGFQTELRITGNCLGTLGGNWHSPECMFRYSIIFKKPSEFIDIDRAAFALAHPASMRRLGFALLEQHSELEPGFGGHYGHITAKSNDPLAGTMGHIFVPGSNGNETKEKSRTAVLEAAEATTSHLEKVA